MALYRFLLNDFKSCNSLFKVLLIFPSQYLFAIGFPFIFSFRRCLPPILGSVTRLPDSEKVSVSLVDTVYGAFTLSGILFLGIYVSTLLKSTS